MNVNFPSEEHHTEFISKNDEIKRDESFIMMDARGRENAMHEHHDSVLKVWKKN